MLWKVIELCFSWSDFCGRAACDFRGVEHRIRSQMRRLGRQHLLFAVDQIRRVEARQFESVAVGDGVGWARLYAIPAENTAVVVNVVNLGIALGAAYPVLSRVLRRLNVNAISRAVPRPQKPGHALFQPIPIALQ